LNREFPDEASWRKYGASGKLSRGDWRRENVNTFISRVYTSIKATKPWVKFGIAPFGIWRPGEPPQITGFDAYAKLYADSRKWLANGWVDYFSPQLYWRIEQKEQSFPVLLDWWSQQNIKHRHLWPGLSVSGALSQEWRAGEIPDQIRFVRKQPGDDGFIFYNATSLLTNSVRGQELQRGLLAGFNGQPALIPASPWLASGAPLKPNLLTSETSSGVRLVWSASGTNGSPVRWWVVQAKSGDWKSEVLPKEATSETLSGRFEAVAVTAIDRAGNASPPQVVEMKRHPPQQRILLNGK
jgi:uncharacterized lipoprotein YddW (UPF0748 family)